jgi:arginine transport system substrate-binding protein
MFKHFLFLILILMGCSKPQPNDTLVVGLQADYPPYEFVNEQGNVVGFDVDVAQRIASLMGKKLVIKEMGFDALILSLKTHKIDLIISGMSITSDRLKEIEMVPYQGDKVTELQLLFWKTEGKAIQELKGKTVVAQSGTFQEEVLHHYTDVKPKFLDSTQELVMEIKYGKSDAALVESAVGKEFQFQFPEIHAVALPLSSAQQAFGNGIGISKDDPQLKEAVEKNVQQLKASGEMDRLKRKWFHD